MRLLEGVSKEPQGKVPSLSSLKPRAAGYSRLKCADVREVNTASAVSVDFIVRLWEWFRAAKGRTRVARSWRGKRRSRN